MSFGSFVEIYLEDCKTRLRRTTCENKTFLINSKILPTFKNMPLNEIKPTTILQWQNKLLGEKYAPTYLRTVHNQISAIFNYAARYYGLPFNPAVRCGSMGKKNAEAMQF